MTSVIGLDSKRVKELCEKAKEEVNKKLSYTENIYYFPISIRQQKPNHINYPDNRVVEIISVSFTLSNQNWHNNFK